MNKRKPTHPGKILDEHYIKTLNLNLQELADELEISRNTLFKIRKGKIEITPDIAIKLSKIFDTTPNLWLNLQQKYENGMIGITNSNNKVLEDLNFARRAEQAEKEWIAGGCKGVFIEDLCKELDIEL